MRFDFTRPILSQRDYSRLSQLNFDKSVPIKSRSLLRKELDRAQVLPTALIPRSVVSMNSHVILREVETGKQLNVKLVYPRMGNFAEGKIAVSSKLGLAMLGEQSGATIQWEPARGRSRQFEITVITYQPESAGEDD